MRNESKTLEPQSPRAPHPVATPTDLFAPRHLGPRDADIDAMLRTLGVDSLDALIDATIPESIRHRAPLDLPAARGEHELLDALRDLAARNQVFRSCIGMGYYGTFTPPVIQRNVLENPGWYTQYTPYQAEIAQGRLEALLTFQTMVEDLTGLELANASLLDEATAAAEAMAMCAAIAGGRKRERTAFFASNDCHPQTLAVLRTRADALGLQLLVGAPGDLDLAAGKLCGVLLQTPTTDGRLLDLRALIKSVHAAGALAVVATDLLALTLLVPPGEQGADIAIGSTQRFGVPMGYGGPHAAFLATHAEHARKVPGRLVGVSKDAHGRPAFRLTLQTREQHIRRDKATSNICTAQVLPAILASMYAVYHGPEGLRAIAERVHGLTRALAAGLHRLGADIGDAPFFDTLCVRYDAAETPRVLEEARARRINLRRFDDDRIGIALDETSHPELVADILAAFAAAAGGKAAGGKTTPPDAAEVPALAGEPPFTLPAPFARTSDYLTHPVFQRYRSETEMLRYLSRLQARDLSLTTSMIPLGSCTMKLNGTSEMMPISWPEFAHLHPFAPVEQAQGYRRLFADLEAWLAEITGFHAVSLQPNAGSQGEYTGLMVIRAWHRQRGDTGRNVCLIPVSAHGTNAASAVTAGYRVVPVACDARGNIDIADLRRQAEAHRDALGALMITYPSTHGVFETTIRELCDIVHAHGGQVYLDGANMNAQVGLARPAEMGADVCHLNLHKTFCIPHGGGGPGMGPIAVAEHLAPFLPGHPVVPPDTAGAHAIGPVAAAPWGSPSILPISWMYIALMGPDGLRRASEIAILNANYMAARLAEHYSILYTGENGRVAHEFIVDLRPFEKSAGIKIDDVAKRLMDYGFHAPTMSWPVPGTLMIEPTESESRAELDRFCDAMIAIRDEIRQIEAGTLDSDDNPLRNAPHTAEDVAADTWSHPYGREQAAFPLADLRRSKFWPPVSRIDNYYGDRNLFCACPPPEAWAE